MVERVAMNARWNLFAGTLTRYLLLAVNIGMGVFLMPFTVHHLGTTEYGVWMLAASLTAYFQLLDLGYGSGLVRHVAAADAAGDVPGVNRLLSTFVVVYGVLGIAACAGIAVIVVWVVPRFPHLTPAQIAEARFVLAVLGLRVAAGFPMTVFGAATTARQRFALNNLVAIGATVLNGAVTFALIEAGFHVRAIVAGSTAVAFAGYAGYMWTATRAFPELRLRLSSFSRPLVRDVTAFSLYLFVIDIAIQIGFNLDNVVIAAALGAPAVAIYAVTLRLADYQRQVSNQFNTLMFPVVVRYGALEQGEARQALGALLVDGTRLALILVCGVTVCLMGFASPLIAGWMGPGFEASVLPLQVLAVAGVVLVGQGTLGNILLGTGRHRLVAFASLGEAVANLILSVILVRRYGLAGVAIGTALPVVIVNLFVLAPSACRQAGIGVASFARAVTAAPLVGVLIAAPAGAALRGWRPPQSVAGVLVEAAAVGLFYLLVVWTIGFDHGVRARYRTYGRDMVAAAFTRASLPA
jgi:O-antigen/teichoic acid export membrane protein